MLQNIRIIIAIALVAGIIWNCGSERVTQSEIGTEEQIGRPLSKLAAQQNAIVIATVQQNDAPVSGAKVEFARSIAGQKADYQWSDMTDENGQVRIEITAGNGYYQVRASQDGIEIGSWTSIPINEGQKIRLNLPIGGKAELTLVGPPAEITIGVVLPLTGHLAALSPAIKNGLELAREEINQSPLLGETKIEFIIEDNGTTSEGTIAAYNKLIHRDGVSVIIGPFASTTTREAFPIAQQNQIVAISPTSAARGLSAIGDFVFRTILTVDRVVPGGVKTTHEKLGYQRVATIYQSDDVFSQSSNEAILKALQQNGVGVITTETFQTGDTDFSEQLTRIKESNPDAIFLSALPIEKEAVLIQIRQIGIPAEVHFITLTLTAGNVQRAGPAAEGAISFTVWSSLADTPRNRAFVENYTMKYNAEPDEFVAQAYTAVHILANAIAAAPSTASEAIRDAMAHITNLDTILGKFSFDANGDAIYNPIVLIVKNGKFEVFNP